MTGDLPSGNHGLHYLGMLYELSLSKLPQLNEENPTLGNYDVDNFLKRSFILIHRYCV